MTKGNVAVIGAGNTGASWAGLFAAHGYEVRLYDVRDGAAAAALGRAAAAARFLVAKGLVEAGPADEGIPALAAASTVAEAVDGAILVQECVSDDLDLKQRVFADIGRHAPADDAHRHEFLRALHHGHPA